LRPPPSGPSDRHRSKPKTAPTAPLVSPAIHHHPTQKPFPSWRGSGVEIQPFPLSKNSATPTTTAPIPRPPQQARPAKEVRRACLPHHKPTAHPSLQAKEGPKHHKTKTPTARQSHRQPRENTTKPKTTPPAPLPPLNPKPLTPKLYPPHPQAGAHYPAPPTLKVYPSSLPTNLAECRTFPCPRKKTAARTKPELQF
jgi:hypothetical protein